MPVSTSKQWRESPRTVSHETVIRRGGAQAPTVKFNLDDGGNVVASSIRIASRGVDYDPAKNPAMASRATRNVNTPLRPQAPRTVAFASGAEHPSPDAGIPNFDVDLTSIRLVSSEPREIVAPAAIRLEIVNAPSVAPHERPVWAHECSVCRDEWFARATLETPVLSGICTGHAASTCPQCIEAHGVQVARAKKGHSKAEMALSTAKTPKAYLRAEKRVNLWKSKLSKLGNGPTGVCPRHDSKPVFEPVAIPANFARPSNALDASETAWLRNIDALAATHGVKRQQGVDASTADALRRAGIAVPPVPLGGSRARTVSAPPVGAMSATERSALARKSSEERDALSEGIAAGITLAPDASKIRRATVTEPSPRETATHDAYALRGVGVVAVDATYHARTVAEKWRQRARATDKVCAVCRRMECPAVRRTGAPCVASGVRTPAAPSAPSTAPAKGVYVAPSTVASHGKHGSTYTAPAETLPKPRVAPARVESPAVTARRIEGERTTPARPHGPYETAPRGRIVT